MALVTDVRVYAEKANKIWRKGGTHIPHICYIKLYGTFKERIIRHLGRYIDTQSEVVMNET